MSEKLLKFLLSELRIVRVVCQNPRCQGTVEVPLDCLGDAMGESRCPLCKSPFGHPQAENAFRALAVAVGRLAAMEKSVQVQFVLPDKG